MRMSQFSFKSFLMKDLHGFLKTEFKNSAIFSWKKINITELWDFRKVKQTIWTAVQTLEFE